MKKKGIFPPLFPRLFPLFTFSHISLSLISIPVRHHRDHRNLRVRRVPQILEETQTAVHPGLLRQLLHPRISHDHRGTTRRHKTYIYICVHTDASPSGGTLAFSRHPRDSFFE